MDINFPTARFIIGFIVFILAFMIASWSYDAYFHALTAIMFFVAIWVMNQLNKTHQDQIADLEKKHQEKILEIYEELAQSEVSFEEITTPEK